MRHALILRTLSLPLIAALGVCSAMVAMTAFTQLASQSRQSAPSIDSPDARTTSVNSPTARLSAESTPNESKVVLDLREVECSFDAPADGGETSLQLTQQLVGTLHDDASPRTPRHSHILNLEDLLALVSEETLDTIIRQGRRVIEMTHHVSVTLGDASPRQTADTVATDPTILVNGGEDSTEEKAVEQVDGVPTPEADAHSVYVCNSGNSELSVSFLLDKQVLKLAPGEDVSSDLEGVFVRFDPGGGRDTETRLLTAGRYEFRLTTEGWDLQPASP